MYDKLSKTTYCEDDVEEINKRYLVQFDKKAKENIAYHESSESEDDKINEDNYEPATNPDEEW